MPLHSVLGPVFHRPLWRALEGNRNDDEGDPTALTASLLGTTLGITTARTGPAQGHLLNTAPGKGFYDAATNEPIFERGVIASIPVLGLKVQGSSTPLVSYSNDLSNAAWTKTNATVEQQTSDGVADAPWSRVTGTAANWTVTRTVTRSSANRTTRWRIEAPATNVGDVTVSHNGGTNRVTVTPGSSRDIVLPAATFANPAFELRGTNSGDVAYHYDAQHEELAAGIPAFAWHAVQGGSPAAVGATAEVRALASPANIDVTILFNAPLESATESFGILAFDQDTNNRLQIYRRAATNNIVLVHRIAGVDLELHGQIIEITANELVLLQMQASNGVLRVAVNGGSWINFTGGTLPGYTNMRVAGREFPSANRMLTPFWAFRDNAQTLLPPPYGFNLQALAAFEAAL